jgi:lambda repressor-like predicted transcriptional regulator
MGVKADLLRPGKVSAHTADVGQTPPSKIADRIRAHCLDAGVSVRSLSSSAGLNPSQLGGILVRLDNGQHVAASILAAVAKAMGRTSEWLLTGADPDGVRLRDVPGWAEAAAQAADRYTLRADAIEAVGDWRMPTAPKRIDAAFVAAIARAWEDAS